jgi:hypothetical protein
MWFNCWLLYLECPDPLCLALRQWISIDPQRNASRRESLQCRRQVPHQSTYYNYLFSMQCIYYNNNVQAGFRRVGSGVTMAYVLHDKQHPSRLLAPEKDTVSSKIYILLIFCWFIVSGNPIQASTYYGVAFWQLRELIIAEHTYDSTSTNVFLIVMLQLRG